MFGSKVYDNSNNEFHLDAKCKRLSEIPRKYRYRFWRFPTIFSCGYEPCPECAKNFEREVDDVKAYILYLHDKKWKGLKIKDDGYEFKGKFPFGNVTIPNDKIIFDTDRKKCYYCYWL